MITPWHWARASHGVALANARAAATEQSRRRVERDEVDLYLADRHDRGSAAPRPA